MKKAIFVFVVLILFIVLKTVFGEKQIQTKQHSDRHQNLDAIQKQSIQSDRVQKINERCWPPRCNLICPIQAPPSPYPVRNPTGSQPFPPGPFRPPNVAPLISNGLSWLNQLWDREFSDWFEDRAKVHPALERIKLTKRQKQIILKQLELGNNNGKQPYKFRDISPNGCYVYCEQYQVFQQQQQPIGIYPGVLPNQPGIQQRPTGIYQGVPPNQPVVTPSQLSPVRPPAPPNINRPASIIPGLPVPPSLGQLIPPILGKPVTTAPAQIAPTNPGKPGAWITGKPGSSVSGKPGSSVSATPGSSGSGKPVSTGPSQQKPIGTGSSTPSNQEESDSEEEEDEDDDEDEPYHEGEDKPVEVTASPPDKRSHKAKGKHKEKRREKFHHQKQNNYN